MSDPQQPHGLQPSRFLHPWDFPGKSTGVRSLQSPTAGKNINNLRYADDTTLMAEIEQELKSLLMKVKEESEKVALSSTFRKLRSWHLVPSHHG